MAVQAGFGLSRVIILLGAGYTGTILLQKGKLSDLLGELQSLLKGNGKGGESEADSDPVTAQIQQLAMEVRKLASARPITVFNGDSRQNGLASLVVPTAVFGALGYGYMKWKGITFSDLMYVTKRNMAAVVTNLTKHLADVTQAVDTTKRQLTGKIEKLDTKMDDQLGLSQLLKEDILDVRDDLSKLLYSVDDIEECLLALRDTMGTLDEKQNFANMALGHLLRIAHGEQIKLPERLQELIETLGKLEANVNLNLKHVVKRSELQSERRRSITDSFSGEGKNSLNDKKSKSRESIIDYFSGDGNDKLNHKPRALFRRPSLRFDGSIYKEGCCEV